MLIHISSLEHADTHFQHVVYRYCTISRNIPLHPPMRMNNQIFLFVSFDQTDFFRTALEEKNFQSWEISNFQDLHHTIDRICYCRQPVVFYLFHTSFCFVARYED